MKNNKLFYLLLTALCIVFNFVVSGIVEMLRIPLVFFDSIGTIFISCYLGIKYGMAAGFLSSIMKGLLINSASLPFSIVSLVIGLVSGLVAKRFVYNYKIAFLTGLLIAFICPIIGAPIAVYVYGGLTGDGTDLLFMWLLHSGKDIFSAAFWPRFYGNIIDKVLTSLIAAYLLKNMPAKYIYRTKNELVYKLRKMNRQ